MAPDPKQYTREKYEAFMRQNPPRNHPQTVPSTSSAGPSQSAPSTATSVPQVQTHSTQAQPLPPGSVELVANFVPPAKTAKEVEEENRKSGFQKLVHRQVTAVEDRGADLPAPVQANYFKVTFSSNLDLRRYRIHLDKINLKDVIKRELRRTLIKELLLQNPPSGIWVSDYSEYIVSVGKLYPDLTDAPGATVEVLHHRPGRDQTWVPMRSFIIYEGPFQRSALDTHLSSINSSFVPDADLRMLNIISWFRINGYNPQNGPIFDGFRVGNKFYPSVGGVIPFHTVPLRRTPIFLIRAGFYTSMRPAIGSVLLNVNTVTSAFFPPEVLSTWIRLRWEQEIPPVNEQNDLIGLRVTFSGDGANPKMRVIRDVHNLNVDQVTFTPKDADGAPGQITSVYNHMRNKYHLLRFNPSTCCLNMGTATDPKWYPADNLRIVAGQIFKKQLSDHLGSQMIKIAQNEPENNKRLILRGALLSLGIPATTGSFSQFGLSINHEFEEVVPRYLCQPTLISNLNIILLNTGNNASEDQVRKFAQDLGRKIRDYGVTFTGRENISNASFSRIRVTFCNELNAALAVLRSENRGRNPRLLLVVVPDKDIRTYANIKWWGDCVAGIPTICITRGVLTKGERIRNVFQTDIGVISNISLKINFKLGGISHLLNDEASQRIFWAGAKANTMIVGADVSHAGKGRDATCPSMAGVVATCDQLCSKYFASARLQENNTESIADLADMIGERLDKYRRVNDSLPEHILFYRDGVSESQYGMVVNDEIPLVRAGCRAAGARGGKGNSWCPKITLLVVGKRHHTRFFPKLAQNIKFNNNLPSGLVIDSGVVTPNHFSFYLQSHDSALGTARSAHYIVIINESDYTPESIQETTNTICFTGSRAFKALSVCTPAKYADILCDRMRCYMKPALDNDFAATSPNDLNFYRSNADIWNTLVFYASTKDCRNKAYNNGMYYVTQILRGYTDMNFREDVKYEDKEHKIVKWEEEKYSTKVYEILKKLAANWDNTRPLYVPKIRAASPGLSDDENPKEGATVVETPSTHHDSPPLEETSSSKQATGSQQKKDRKPEVPSKSRPIPPKTELAHRHRGGNPSSKSDSIKDVKSSVPSSSTREPPQIRGGSSNGDGDPTSIRSWRRYNSPVLPELLSSNFHDSKGINGFPAYVFPGANAIAALTNAPIAGRKRFNYYPGTFATDGAVYSDIVVFGYAAVSPDHKLYMIKMLVRNSTKTPTVQKALLARTFLPTFSIEEATWGQFIGFSDKPNTLTTVGAQPEKKPPDTPSKVTPDNPVKAESSKTAANQKLFSSPPNEDKDPKQLSPWQKIYNNSIRNSPKAVVPIEEVKVDLGTTKSKKMSELITTTTDVIRLNSTTTRMLYESSEDVLQLFGAITDAGVIVQIIIDKIGDAEGGEAFVADLQSVLNIFGRKDRNNEEPMLEATSKYQEVSKAWIESMQDAFKDSPSMVATLSVVREAHMESYEFKNTDTTDEKSAFD
ncbi:hypothetical protein BTUL_0196g00060 [Botrytis tulipae]|uniref:Piwi domain-containing protein n=1 Tax=Botrytis tulipae TaxID=87230 RepID=A0A4Z1ED64_9HELO|nr:hypothetical protein BTUL_0196g00060 [Botrytis tulipae]